MAEPSSDWAPDSSPDSAPNLPDAPRRKSIRITPAKLRAQRANARLSRGPRTPEGRRRSALNRRGTDLARIYTAPGAGRELRRLWRDLLAQFWFVKRELWRADPWLELRLEGLTVAWWHKLGLVQKGLGGQSLWPANQEIDRHLSKFLSQARIGDQKTDDWLRKQFGTDGRANLPALRESIEGRLGTFRSVGKRATETRASDSQSG